MPLLRRHPRAEQDLIDIFHYIYRDNSAAEKFVRAVDSKCELLARNPMFGRARPELRRDLRSFPHGAYIILYRIVENGVEIVRVAHAARNLDDLV